MSSKKGVLLVLATAIISGFAIFINKFSVAKIEPSVFTFLKNAVVALLLLSIIMLTRNYKGLAGLTKKQWLRLILIGFVGGSIPFILFFNGLSMASAPMAAFLHKTLFIYASMLAFVFLKEKPDKRIVIAAILLLAGNLLLLRLKSFAFSSGEALILIATFLWAAENVLAKHALKELSGNIVAFGRMFFGSFFILIYLFISNKASLLPTLSFDAYLWSLMTSLILMGYVITYYNGLKHIKVSTATSILLLGSPITTLLTSLYSKTPIPITQILGILLIIAGVAAIIVIAEFSKAFLQHSRSESL